MADEKTRPPKIFIQDIMVSKVYRVTPEMKLWEVAELFIKRLISGAPVVDQNDKVISMIGEGDTLRMAALHGLEATVAHCLPEILQTEDIISLQIKSTFQEAYRVFLKHRIHRIPVTDSSGKLQGLVTRSTVLTLFVESHYGKKITKTA
jgi:predicted transcriptional regulator